MPGTYGVEWNAIIAESGYSNPIVTSVTDNSSYITSGTGAGTNNATYADWRFNWQIPPNDLTVYIQVNGTVVAPTQATAATTRATAATTRATAATTKLPAPVINNFRAVSVGSDEIETLWDSVTGATGNLTITWGTGGSYTNVGSGTSTSFGDGSFNLENLSADTTYYIRMTASNAGGATTATAITTSDIQATMATIKPTQATAATTRATVDPGDGYFYYIVEDCNGEQWTARSGYMTPRFTRHDSFIKQSSVGRGPYWIVNTTFGPDNQLILAGPTEEECGRQGPAGPGDEGFDGF